jgi:hypothetical protein
MSDDDPMGRYAGLGEGLPLLVAEATPVDDVLVAV